MGGKMWKKCHTHIILFSFIFTVAALQYEVKKYSIKYVLKDTEVKLFVTAGYAWKSWRRKKRNRSGMTVTGLKSLRMRWQRETGESSERITTLPSRVGDSSDIAGSDHAAYHRVKPKCCFRQWELHFTAVLLTLTAICYIDCSSTCFWSGWPNTVLVILNYYPCIKYGH